MPLLGKRRAKNTRSLSQDPFINPKIEFLTFVQRFFTMTLKEKQQEIVQDFAFLEDWEQKYEYIIDLGKELEGLSPEKKTDANLIKGCQSKVWIDADFKDGILYFNADSDGILPKGIISLLVSIYSGHSTQEIVDSDFDFISQIGLQEFLSPSRANGLMAMTKQIKFYAVAFQLKK
jgi:cysteine desulfuration protein SufE